MHPIFYSVAGKAAKVAQAPWHPTHAEVAQLQTVGAGLAILAVFFLIVPVLRMLTGSSRSSSSS